MLRISRTCPHEGPLLADRFNGSDPATAKSFIDPSVRNKPIVIEHSSELS
jgi:hypothetical protein